MDVMVNWVERARMLAVAAVLALGTAHAEKTVVFFTPWSNTNAVLFVGGDSVATMTPLENYCGWFKATVDAPAEGFGVYFKQTVGLNYVGAEGMVAEEPTESSEILLDSVAALPIRSGCRATRPTFPRCFPVTPACLATARSRRFP